MIYFLLFNVLLSGAFARKWRIPCGTYGPRGRIHVADTDHDSRIELIFGSLGPNLDERVVIYELDSGDTFALQVVVDTVTTCVWATGDFDNDGKSDILLGGEFGLPVVGPQIYESPDYFSYPIIEAWRDTVGQASMLPMSSFDIDQDGIPEFITNNGNPPNWLWIFEAIGDNQYDTVYTSSSGSNSTHAYGDFDLDGKIEFACGDLGGTYWVYECSENNKYKRIIRDQLPTGNIKDCFSVPDADSDGKMEFVVKGYNILNSRTHAFIFEATGNDTYAMIKYFDLFGSGMYGSYSDAGDVDRDGIPEIVLATSHYNIYIIKAEGNDSFFVWDTLPGYWRGSSNVRVFDIDGNGLAEVIISGKNLTYIYEYIPPAVEEQKKITNTTPQISISPNPFTTATRIELVCANRNQESNLTIYDCTGRLMNSVKLTTSTHQLGTDLVPGIYFLKLNGKPVGKVVKVR